MSIDEFRVLVERAQPLYGSLRRDVERLIGGTDDRIVGVGDCILGPDGNPLVHPNAILWDEAEAGRVANRIKAELAAVESMSQSIAVWSQKAPSNRGMKKGDFVSSGRRVRLRG